MGEDGRNIGTGGGNYNEEFRDYYNITAKEITITSGTSDVNNKTSQSESFLDKEQKTNAQQLGRVIYSDHKYDGQLVLIELQIVNESGIIENREIAVKLNIAFMEVEEVFTYKNKYFFASNTEACIRFGVKEGRLNLKLKNGIMPLSKRKLTEDPKGEWKINTAGIQENPTWQFKAKEKSAILEGSRTFEKLGIVECSDSPLITEATFNISISSNDLEITAQDGAWNSETESKLKIETKRRVFLKRFVEPRLKDYVSKVVLKYD